jgi:cobalt-zinc-cadmium efflux system membrane fusion protein
VTQPDPNAQPDPAAQPGSTPAGTPPAPPPSTPPPPRKISATNTRKVSGTGTPAAMPRTPQFVIAGSLIGGLVIGLLVGVMIGKVLNGPSPVVETATTAVAIPAGDQQAPETTTTLPTDQIHALTIGTVTDHQFRPEMQTTGKIANDDDLTTPVFSLVGGHAVTLSAKPGDLVAPQQALVQIDSPDMFQAEVGLVAAIPATNKARLALEQLKRIAARQQKLFDLHAIALKDLEQAQADVRSAETDLKAAEVAQEAARGQLRIFGKADADIQALEQGTSPSRLAVVRSPIAGTVVSRKIGTGQVVRPDNADPMFTVADLSQVWMSADIYETDARWISIGQPVEVRVMAFPDDVYPAAISYVSPAVDPNTHRITVRCTVANKDGKLRPEMFATFRVFSSSTVLAPSVPISALIHVGAATYVWTYHDDNKFTKHEVDCGPPQDGVVQVHKGLKTGDRIVLKGGIFLDSQ